MKIFIVIFLSILCACSVTADEGLRKSIDIYFSLEKSRQWSEVYAHRPEKIKESYEQDYFIRMMESGSEGWELLDWKVIKIDFESENKANVLIKFKENISQSVAQELGLSKEVSEFSVKEWTVWVRSENDWRCLDCGQRLHLPLNSE